MLDIQVRTSELRAQKLKRKLQNCQKRMTRNLELPTTIYFVLPSQIFSLDQKISLFALRNQVRAAVTMSVANVTCFDFGRNKRFATANSTVRSL